MAAAQAEFLSSLTTDLSSGFSANLLDCGASGRHLEAFLVLSNWGSGRPRLSPDSELGTEPFGYTEWGETGASADVFGIRANLHDLGPQSLEEQGCGEVSDSSGSPNESSRGYFVQLKAQVRSKQFKAEPVEGISTMAQPDYAQRPPT